MSFLDDFPDLDSFLKVCPVYGSIHVYVPYFSQDVLASERYTDLRRAQLIIHEASHKFFYTDDHAYANEADYQELSQEQLLDNAGSFGYAAVSLHAKRAHSRRRCK